ncbi:HlyD family secretion protein [Phenylobacterium sp.]|jgi:membrane fusion protein (multidrug efflux system)|uniref:HlyD family secretion protein n=1 Tax=Phenylobacterium sp. TaxID=1871053 RepID=UPI002E34E476|nr:HlyD family secretion protein [Phenylobacterium sp.]HEX3365055.1 HlyD family secretion protein [Phenylobacterium sp.]
MKRLKIDRSFLLEAAWRALVFIVALLILIIVTTRWNGWQGRAGWQSTDDAYLQADITPIAAKVTGYVRAVPVSDFERVRAGQLLAEITDDDYRTALAQAEAGVASAKAQVAALTAQESLQGANVAAANAQVASVAANLTQNGRDVARQRRLVAGGSSSAETGERLDTTGQQLSAQLAQTRAQADAARKQRAVLAAQREQAEAAVAAQTANLQQARLNLGYTRITAPVDGVLGQRQVRPGQFVGVGGQVDTLTPLPHVWVIANYRETQLTHMAVGQKAEVRVDTFPGHVLRGHVLAFAPASGSQFALLPPDNATGNFTKVVQRVAVKIALDDTAGLGDRLRPGLSVVARIDAEDSVR